MTAWPPEKRDEVLALLRDGVGVKETSRRTDVPPQTVSRWGQAAGIEVASAAQTEAACEATRLAWAQRRSALADRMGDVIALALDRVEDADDGKAAKDWAVTAAVLVDKAQLVSGGVTSRHEQLDADRRAERVRQLEDELEERRRAKEAAGG